MNANEHIEQVCKIGQGAACCKYPLMGMEGWCCGKLDPYLKRLIDAAAHRMKAKGDNCEGHDISDVTRPINPIGASVIFKDITEH